jgi:septal ring-binding cell division protein DamX
MRRVEVALLTVAVASSAFAQTYDKTDTFEPGKKYTCVPTADRKGWDCNEAGKSVEIKTKQNETPPPIATTAESNPPPPAQPPARSTLPSYLTNAAASSPAPRDEPPSTVSAAAAHANAPAPAAPAPVEKQEAPSAVPAPTAHTDVPAQSAPRPATTKTVPLQPATPHSTPTPAPVSPPPAKSMVAPRATHPPVAEAAPGGGDFLSLPGDHFVVEMARAASKSEVDAARSSAHVPTGDLYELHLRQNGADAWLLLWGSFDSLEAARAARASLTGATPGWPRRIAPLQAEARRSSP